MPFRRSASAKKTAKAKRGDAATSPASSPSSPTSVITSVEAAAPKGSPSDDPSQVDPMSIAAAAVETVTETTKDVTKDAADAARDLIGRHPFVIFDTNQDGAGDDEGEGGDEGDGDEFASVEASTSLSTVDVDGCTALPSIQNLPLRQHGNLLGGTSSRTATLSLARRRSGLSVDQTAESSIDLGIVDDVARSVVGIMGLQGEVTQDSDTLSITLDHTFLSDDGDPSESVNISLNSYASSTMFGDLETLFGDLDLETLGEKFDEEFLSRLKRTIDGGVESLDPTKSIMSVKEFEEAIISELQDVIEPKSNSYRTRFLTSIDEATKLFASGDDSGAVEAPDGPAASSQRRFRLARVPSMAKNTSDRLGASGRGQVQEVDTYDDKSAEELAEEQEQKEKRRNKLKRLYTSIMAQRARAREANEKNKEVRFSCNVIDGTTKEGEKEATARKKSVQPEKETTLEEDITDFAVEVCLVTGDIGEDLAIFGASVALGLALGLEGLAAVAESMANDTERKPQRRKPKGKGEHSKKSRESSSTTNVSQDGTAETEDSDEYERDVKFEDQGEGMEMTMDQFRSVVDTDDANASTTQYEEDLLNRVTELLDTLYGDSKKNQKKKWSVRASKVLGHFKGKEDELVTLLESKAAAKAEVPQFKAPTTTGGAETLERDGEANCDSDALVKTSTGSTNNTKKKHFLVIFRGAKKKAEQTLAVVSMVSGSKTRHLQQEGGGDSSRRSPGVQINLGNFVPAANKKDYLQMFDDRSCTYTVYSNANNKSAIIHAPAPYDYSSVLIKNNENQATTCLAAGGPYDLSLFSSEPTTVIESEDSDDTHSDLNQSCCDSQAAIKLPPKSDSFEGSEALKDDYASDDDEVEAFQQDTKALASWRKVLRHRRTEYAQFSRP